MSPPNPVQIFHDAWAQVERLSQRLSTESAPDQREMLEIQRARFQDILNRVPGLAAPVGPRMADPESSPEDMECAWQHMLDEVPASLLTIP